MPKWEPSLEYVNELRNERWDAKDVADQLARVFDWRFRLNIAISGLLGSFALVALAVFCHRVQELMDGALLYEWLGMDVYCIFYVVAFVMSGYGAFNYLLNAADNGTQYANQVRKFFTPIIGDD